MKNRAALLACIPAISFLAVAPATVAFDYPLSETTIRDAFLTGKDTIGSGRGGELFLKYERDFAAPQSGPYVAKIRLQTPYEQLAQVGASAANYHTEEAVQRFLGKPLPFRVSVEIQFTPSYPASFESEPAGAYSLLQPMPNFQNDFQVEVSQDKTITPISTRAFLNSSDLSGTVWSIQGVVIQQEYDPKQIDSSELTVNVHTPDGQDIATTFNMAQLR